MKTTWCDRCGDAMEHRPTNPRQMKPATIDVRLTKRDPSVKFDTEEMVVTVAVTTKNDALGMPDLCDECLARIVTAVLNGYMTLALDIVVKEVGQ